MSSNKSTNVVFIKDAQQEILRGSKRLFEAVKTTMGPSGHSVIIERPNQQAPFITKDGVTVAKAINLKPKLEAVGANLVKEVASKTNDIAGDGTTTATVLGYSMLEHGFKMIGMGFSPIEVKQGMDDAVAEVIDILTSKATQVSSIEDSENVATISANGDRELGKIIAEAIDKVGVNGIITVEPAKNFQTTLQMANGIMIDGGYTSPFFITNNEKANCVLENPLVLITTQKIASVTDILPLLEGISVRNKPILIICEDVEGEALQTLITNKMRGTIQVCAVKAPSFGDFRFELLSDIAHVLDTEVVGVNSEYGLKNIPLNKLGKCVRATITRTATILVAKDDEETKSKIATRAKQIEEALAKPSDIPDEATYNRLRHRLAKLTGGVAVIRVGGSTEVEIGEKKDRVDDALNATLAATREGIVAGGGMALYYCARILELGLEEKHLLTETKSDSYYAGYKTIIKACETPFKTIVSNTGRSEDVFADLVNKHFKLALGNTQWSKMNGEMRPWSLPGSEYLGNIFRFGVDARSGEWKDLVEAGIIDPVLVTKSALSFANSIVGLTLTCNAIIVEDTEENEND